MMPTTAIDTSTITQVFDEDAAGAGLGPGAGAGGGTIALMARFTSLVVPLLNMMLWAAIVSGVEPGSNRSVGGA